jgi:serine/threonine protein kinase
VARSSRYKRGQRLGQWTLQRFVDAGGNGEVWEAESDEAQPVALKILHRFSGDGYPRFKREVEIVQALDPERLAILPIVDSHVPETPSRDDPPWYVMPLATSIRDALGEAPLVEKVDAIRQIGSTLADVLNESAVTHRDVKLANLYQWRGRFVVGDFGLAKRPDDDDLTGGRAIGPWAHLPSEVFIQDEEPDWEKVDVHCLANSLWQLIAVTDAPPRGPILAEGRYSLTQYANEPYVRQLDLIIAGATSENPPSRPSMSELAQQLKHWIEGRDIQDSILAEDERMRKNRKAVLRWLVSHVREKPVFDLLQWETEQDRSAPSSIPGLTEGDVAEALDELLERGYIDADRSEAMGGHVWWTQLYPNLFGIMEVEDVEVLFAQAAPLARELLRPQDALLLPMQEAEIEIGAVRLTPAEAYFQLRLLSSQMYVDFENANETRGGSLMLFDVRTTASGRDWLVERYSGS